MATLGKAPIIDPKSLVSAQTDAAKQISDMNASLFPQISQQALGESLKIGSTLNQAMAASFYQNLGVDRAGLLGTQQEAVDKTSAMANEMMSGELPEDVKRAIAQSRAELGISRGLFGEARQFAQAADIGKTSLDMKREGASLYKDVSALTANLLDSALKTMAPTVDLAGLYAGNLSTLSKATMLDATQVQSGVTAALMQNAEMEWARTLSQFNATREDEKISEAQKMAERMAALYSGGGSAGGTVSRPASSMGGGGGFMAPATPISRSGYTGTWRGDASSIPAGTTMAPEASGLSAWDTLTEEDAQGIFDWMNTPSEENGFQTTSDFIDDFYRNG